MPLYALVNGQPRRALKDGPRRASCAECGKPMLARTGQVRIWHWAHLEEDPHCEAARESEWHLAWKVLGPDGRQEVKVGRRRADVLAPGGFAVEFQASALDPEEVRARENDWAVHGGMAWVFKADKEFTAWPLPRITTKGSLAAYKDHLVKPENRATLNITWSHAPERVRAARAPTFLDIGNGELLFIGAWRHESPLTGYGWRVTKDWVVQHLLHGSVIPAPLAKDPVETERKIVAYWTRQAERERAARWRQAAEQQAERERQEAGQRERQERRDRRIRLTHEYLIRRGQTPEPEPAPEAPPASGFVISGGLREWRLAREAKRAEEAAARDGKRSRRCVTGDSASRRQSPGGAETVPRECATVSRPRPRTSQTRSPAC